MNAWRGIRVISALGTPASPFREVTFLSTATRALVNAMKLEQVSRLVCITGIGAGDSMGHGGFLFDNLIYLFFWAKYTPTRIGRRPSFEAAVSNGFRSTKIVGRSERVLAQNKIERFAAAHRTIQSAGALSMVRPVVALERRSIINGAARRRIGAAFGLHRPRGVSMSEWNRLSRRSLMVVALLSVACGSDVSGGPLADAEATDDSAASSAGESTLETDLTGPSTLEEPQARHCVVNEAGEEACFASFRTALGYATRGDTAETMRARGDESLATLVGSLKLRPEDLPWQPTLSTQSTIVTQSAIVRAIFYEHADYRGNSWIIQSSSPCDESHPQVLQFKAGAYWNDRISSLRIYSGCYLELHENYDCGGAANDYWENTNYVGRAMNDQVSCVKIR